ncbi:MAG: glycine cleavage system protein H [Hyphomicrobiales bacterium]
MDEAREDRADHPVLPEQSLPCVWMTAGVLRYRLCDRSYDCEHCPLDAAIRGIDVPGAGAGSALPAAGAPEPPPWAFRDDRRYDAAGLWVADAGDGRLRWGVDAFAVRLLDRITSVVLPATGASLERGRTACWVADDGDLIPLHAPLSGTVVHTNRAVQQDPALLGADPYDAGWLVEARADRPLGDLPGLCTPAARREAAARQLAKLRDVAMRRLAPVPGVGRTAPDGGVPVSDLRRILGAGRYHRLVAAILR